MAKKNDTKKKVGKVVVNAFLGNKRFTNDTRAYMNAEQFSAALAVANTDDVEIVAMLMNSMGGSVIVGNSIVNAMRSIEKDTEAHIDAIAGSMGYFGCLGCKTILAHKNSLIMTHSVQGVAEGSPEDMIAEAEVLKKFRTTIAVILAERMGKTVEEVTEAYLGEDKWFTAEEALAEGLIDGIIDAEALNELPQAAISKSLYHDVVAEWNPTEPQAPVETTDPQAAFVTTLSGDERYFYEDLIWGEKQKLNAANQVLKWTTHATIIALAQKVISESGAKIIELVTLLYGELTEAEASAKADEIIAGCDTTRADGVTAAVKAEHVAAIKLKDTAIAKLTKERDANEQKRAAAQKLADEKVAEVEELQAQLLDREVDRNEPARTGGEGGKTASTKYSWTDNKFNKNA